MDPIAARRAEIDAKQAALQGILQQLQCEAALLMMPVHISWFTAGLNVRGLLADTERPVIFTDGRQRWLVCSHVDSQRLFDEELDRLGFQLKEWQWETGRAALLESIVQGRKVAIDRPIGKAPQLTLPLRLLVRELTVYDQAAYRTLGQAVVHAVEATGRHCAVGQTEEEIAGQLGHRLLRHGIEPAVLSVVADERGSKYRRAGFGPTPVRHTCTIQATGQRDGLYVTCSRTISFGPPPGEYRQAFDLALRLAALYRSLTSAGQTIGGIAQTGRTVLANTPYEYDDRLSVPGYGTGRYPAEELRRAGQEEPLLAGQAVLWQPRVGPAAVVDTFLVTTEQPIPITPPEDWPVVRLSVRGGPYYDIPDILIR
ncbi:MAG: M24 family metallopeptidase [Gemmataceae bacterium]|nr:M24 family metallopeptidase [Gemmataceae bacterium]MDW8242143.1 M24 family metallopeptidase [Thermogemmata sp.]